MLGVERTLVVSEVPAGHLDPYRRWIAEVRERRDHLADAYVAAGFRAVSTWLSVEHAVVITRAEAPSLSDARDRLAAGSTPFGEWYRDCELRLLGSHPLAPGEPDAELLVEIHADDVDPLDLFIAVPAPLLADQVEEYRVTVQLGDRAAEAAERVRRWGLARFDIWLQATPRATWAVYDAAGDLSHMLRDISTSPDEAMRSQRDFVRRSFGVDLAEDAFAMPLAAWSWSG